MAKILVVDDAAFMRMMLKNILGKNGHQIVGEAQNGAEGVEKYRELRPDVVTMDIIMPEVNGIEAVKKIMSIDPEAKIVMVSALGQEAMVKEALEAGARDFIVKPFKESKVLEVIEKLC
ncbi:response regulator [Candidatus Pyrohabitans sp.]